MLSKDGTIASDLHVSNGIALASAGAVRSGYVLAIDGVVRNN